MSADEPVEDKAKARAEERAERELQLKIDTLELEREKFRYTRQLAIHDRASAAVVRASGALLFANGSVLLVCLNSYKSLGEVASAQTLRDLIGGLSNSFLLAMLAFTFSLVFAAASPSPHRKRLFSAMVPYWAFGTAGIASVLIFIWALLHALSAMKAP